jgi:hypothetical protein
MPERIPFEEAISEKALLKKRFNELSTPQKAALKIFYGLPLTGDELEFWYVSQGSCSYDHLGRVVSTTPIPYHPKEYEQGWLCLGRRWGKTDAFSSTVLAYEAALGGHEEYIRKGAQTAVCFLVAQDLRLARQNLPLIRATIDASPLLKKEVANMTADFIELKNGINIGVAPPNPKALRGYATPVVGMDEVGLWYTDAESANPDYEIERAVKFAQAQFPHRKRLGTSTPWIKEGLLWKYHAAGTEGRNVARDRALEFKGILAMHSSSAASANPLITTEWLEQEHARDPEAFRREALAEFSDAISGFLNAAQLAEAVDKGKGERAPQPGHYYVAALDPAFRKDAFGFTIVHHDKSKGIIVDVIRRWKAIPGSVLNPADVMAEIAPLLNSYGVRVAYSDQYQLEALQQIALGHGFSIEGVDFTAKSKARIFGNLQQLLNQGRLRLLDPDRNGDAREVIHELVILEKRNLPGGGVQIAAPAGKHDDMACVTALAAFKASWMMQTVSREKKDAEPSLFEKCMASVRRKKLERERGMWD